jgi:hypothetical protein
MQFQRIVFALCFLTGSAFAYFESTSEKGVREMNGITFDQMPVFYKDWKLVTVRYRTDSKEMRLTYANDVAMRAMKELNPQYPDGAIFAKIGLMTEDDPSFTSSKVPSGARRVQFMVRDQKKYASTDGWGYALFDANGNVFLDEGIEKKTMACAACHRLVPERNFVFSREMFLGTQSLNSALKLQTPTEAEKVPFTRTLLKELPAPVARLAQGFDYILSLQGDIQKNAFSGTLDEVVPFLIDKTHQKLTPSALVIDERNFTLVTPAKAGKKETCFGVAKGFYRIFVQANGKMVRDATFCK